MDGPLNRVRFVPKRTWSLQDSSARSNGNFAGQSRPILVSGRLTEFDPRAVIATYRQLVAERD